MEIPEDVPVPADAGAQIVPQSLIGERYVQLSPAFQDGMETAEDGHVIPLERTIIPVEPDEALARSEEHTSELQSLMRNSYAVFCLKKKNKIIKTKHTHRPKQMT